MGRNRVTGEPALQAHLPSSAPFPLDPRESMLDFGRRVIVAEAQALSVLVGALDAEFERAVKLLLSLRGRVVVTGMGKSGHIARKVAATLASTGTPALFIHPAEAAHGDLGMLVPGDALLALSNSGGTTELRPILAHAASLDIPIVAISAGGTSPLMQASDIRLLMPPVDEACPDNLAPTTSTAMMMALGDALALATMRERGTSRDGFEMLHPGGVIGRRLMRVTALMHAGDGMPLVAATLSMRDVILVMTARSFGVAGVVDAAGCLRGIITDGDLRRHVDDLLTATAGDVMTRDPVTIPGRCFAEDALAVMNDRKITSVFVVDDVHPERPIGLIHIHDFLRLGLE
ncbi:KpsF/GutQ family sugar-phosphate isomerase [Sphingomonas nostoxanthinifaciens]|uniref:KpsF/GutQ family sugar-phosphate isomerase n=1 Tax=Sphingomonas nostoxanthinifaciens TaxID=2872652 RepID=UPI001CC21F7D|nr:KpsF/GutQ family sugar-phosphate isomerase [Sphingomonas nostoxanthinifaciens]UAK24979.1 KpsF/GutQ family sugar-phosphate isomerase [Sphingomonas nostoxanthinifaciens]